jgi:hypothetical protein
VEQKLEKSKQSKYKESQMYGLYFYCLAITFIYVREVFYYPLKSTSLCGMLIDCSLLEAAAAAAAAICTVGSWVAPQNHNKVV